MNRPIEKRQDIPLESLAEKFEIWRNTRKSAKPMPKELWQAAVKLVEQYSVAIVARRLNISYSKLKKDALEYSKSQNTEIEAETSQTSKPATSPGSLKKEARQYSRSKEVKIEPQNAQMDFIEITSLPALAKQESVIEFEKPSGAKMKMIFKGKADMELLEFGKAFWSEGQ